MYVYGVLRKRSTWALRSVSILSESHMGLLMKFCKGTVTSLMSSQDSELSLCSWSWKEFRSLLVTLDRTLCLRVWQHAASTWRLTLYHCSSILGCAKHRCQYKNEHDKHNKQQTHLLVDVTPNQAGVGPEERDDGVVLVHEHVGAVGHGEDPLRLEVGVGVVGVLL